MTEARKLLIRALDVLEDMWMTDSPDWELGNDIRAELQKPEPVHYQHIVIDDGRQSYTFTRQRLPDGEYRLLAEKIQDD